MLCRPQPGPGPRGAFRPLPPPGLQAGQGRCEVTPPGFSSERQRGLELWRPKAPRPAAGPRLRQLARGARGSEEVGRAERRLPSYLSPGRALTGPRSGLSAPELKGHRGRRNPRPALSDESVNVDFDLTRLSRAHSASKVSICLMGKGTSPPGPAVVCWRHPECPSPSRGDATRCVQAFCEQIEGGADLSGARTPYFCPGKFWRWGDGTADLG